jgi:nucleoside-diphosphate-sugar epimerase
MSVVLVTGAAGFLGRYVGQHFRDQGWTVVGIDSVPLENAPAHNFAAYYSLKLPDGALNKMSPMSAFIAPAVPRCRSQCLTLPQTIMPMPR